MATSWHLCLLSSIMKAGAKKGGRMGGVLPEPPKARGREVYLLLTHGTL